jgi:hypothetical protein
MPDVAEEKTYDLETSYPFELELEDGTKEPITIPRFTTRMKFKLGLKFQKIYESKQVMDDEEAVAMILDLVTPGLLNRKGMKVPTMLSLNTLIMTILSKDHEQIFGKKPENKPMPEPESKKVETLEKTAKRGRPKKNLEA